MLTKAQTIERFCKIANDVMKKKFSSMKPADCICVGHDEFFQYFDPEIMEYIEGAVRVRLLKEGL